MAKASADEVWRAIELFEQGKHSPIWRELRESAELIEKHRKLAVLALVGRNITPTMAEEILTAEHEPSDKFMELLLQKEREALLKRFK
jgi:hypothetical protein